MQLFQHAFVAVVFEDLPSQWEGVEEEVRAEPQMPVVVRTGLSSAYKHAENGRMEVCKACTGSSSLLTSMHSLR
eukprot:1137216-Pelagomonas_calceolata.AAC.3